MNTKWQKTVGGIALATALAGGSAMTYAAETDYNTWDADKSGSVDYNEWGTRFDNDGMFSRWDADRDGMLTNDEYGQGVYNTYDRDKSGDWNEDEYNRFRDDSGDGGWLDV